jgi:hypothetical protein
MDLSAPFVGTLYLPDKEFLGSGSPVFLEDGRPVAAIRWHTWTGRFEVLDTDGNLLAECRPHGVFRRRYPVTARDGRVVVNLVPGGWSTFNGAELTLANGRRLAVRRQSMWSDRKFEFHAPEGLAGRILPTTGAFSFRADSYAFELLLPVMSALEAISLAQALRLVVRAQRSASSAASSAT